MKNISFEFEQFDKINPASSLFDAGFSFQAVVFLKIHLIRTRTVTARYGHI